METLLFLPFPPEDVAAIQGILRSEDCIVGFFNGDLYEIAQYLVSEEFTDFTALLDRNVYTRITSLLDGTSEQRHLQVAAAILAFCQVAKIEFDHASSLYEYASHRGGVEAVRELERLRRADRIRTRSLIDFALGRVPTISPDAIPEPETTGENIPEGKEFERITLTYRVNYTFALKIAELNALEIPQVEKMIQFIDWMHFEFIYGSVALQFANRFFSPSRFKRMLKGRTQREIANAARDMALVQDWRKRALAGADSGKPVLLLTRDRAVREIARRISADTEAEYEAQIADLWGKKSGYGKRIFKRYDELSAKMKTDASRQRPDVPAQKQIMRNLESLVIGKPSNEEGTRVESAPLVTNLAEP